MRINFRRILSADSMSFDLATQPLPPPREDQDDVDPLSPRNVTRVREEVLAELCELLDASGEIANRSRLHRDLDNREKRTCTALGDGIAVPHVRTMQARSFVMAFGRSETGLPFRAPDEEPVHVFFAMVSPPYEDRIYLKIYRTLATALIDPDHRAAIFAARSPNDIWRVLEIFR